MVITIGYCIQLTSFLRFSENFFYAIATLGCYTVIDALVLAADLFIILRGIGIDNRLMVY